jgi:hypothetical protein
MRAFKCAASSNDILPRVINLVNKNRKQPDVAKSYSHGSRRLKQSVNLISFRQIENERPISSLPITGNYPIKWAQN